MKRQLLSRVLLLLAVLLLLNGCMGKAVKFHAPVDQPYDAAKGRSVTGEACGFQLLLLIPININSRAQQAYGSLLEHAGADSVVTDIKVQEKWFYAFVGTVYCTELQGTAYPRLPAPQGG